jgi:hypothetical protein
MKKGGVGGAGASVLKTAGEAATQVAVQGVANA